MYGISIGTVDYVDLADSPDSTRRCVRFGVFLLKDGDRRCAALIRGPDPHGPMQEAMIELISADQDFASELMAELRRLAVEHSVLRGQGADHGSG